MNIEIFSELRREIDDALLDLFPKEDSCPTQLYDAMKYSLFLPAKRFRPILTALTAKTMGADHRIVLPTACAIEFIHTYSLIHDDLPSIDNDDLRRGQPTCHCKFGEDIAMLAGDALFAEAFALIAKHQTGRPRTIVQVLAEIAEASGIHGMVGGQTADVISAGKIIDRQQLDYIHQKKTGCLIRASVRCGALLAEVDDDDLNKLTVYAESLGLAFQIVDDILDVVGSTEELGKPAKSDLEKSKATFPRLFGLKDSQDIASQAVIKAKDALRGLGRSTTELAELADFVIKRTK